MPADRPPLVAWRHLWTAPKGKIKSGNFDIKTKNAFLKKIQKSFHIFGRILVTPKLMIDVLIMQCLF